MSTACEICKRELVSDQKGGALICPDCAVRLRLTAGFDGSQPITGFCRCGTYLGGLPEFLRHVARCGDYGR